MSTSIALNKGAVEVNEKPSKTYQYGNAKVKIVSPLVNMTPQEQHEWFESEWQNGNPVLHDIVEAATDCLLNEEEVS